ncbi:ABC transporter permease [Zooshikella harenae]|uniref:Xylose transport system permease protein XylH n=1 Tax=Zooshikella harenae TaxID=2827238 RepID=A0ABS5ZDZ3_9GAMM|nr:ABC transporter permease [Zooshikella harenae]MBU2711177.1 ABC transporter permease [Zooshikella harenae]
MSTGIVSVENKTHDERLRQQHLLKKALHRPEFGAVAGALLVFGFFGVFANDSGMFSAAGIINFLEVSAQLGILAIAAAMLMIAGEFDLSIGSMIAFAGLVVAIPVAVWDWPLWISIVFAFITALGIGFINGYLVVKTKLPSFIVTLAFLFILRGLAIGFTRLLTGRTQVGGLKEVTENDVLAGLFSGEVGQSFFTWLTEIGWLDTNFAGQPMVTGIPVSIVWWLVIAAIATWVLLMTRFGNWIFACGGDANAARNVGVPVARVKITLFMMTALAATVFACLQVMDAGSADTNRGLLKEFEAIIAVVVGGVLLTGGYGSAIGAVFGALIFGTVQMGIFYTGVNTDWFKVFMGGMMLLAVMFNNYVRKKCLI